VLADGSIKKIGKTSDAVVKANDFIGNTANDDSLVLAMMVQKCN
jgi:hypothetical protein